MISMTGYGRGESESNGRKVVIELRSVNHRFLDLNIKLPRYFLFAEDYIRKTLSSAFARGHIDVFLNYENKSDTSTEITLNASVVAAYIECAKQLNEKYGIVNDLTASTLLKLQDVTTVSEEEDQEILLSLCKDALQQAIDALLIVRTKEGAQLSLDLSSKIDGISLLTVKAEELAPLVVSDYRERLSKRISEALVDVAYDEARFINEIAFFTDKACIDEELTRMKAHIVAAKKFFSSTEPIGKSFDCLVQEMNREANTMGSKANDSRLQNVVVALKTEIEKVREQIQNLE